MNRLQAATVRGALVPALVVAAAGVALAWWVGGTPGAAGAGLGALVALAFFGSGVALMLGTARMDATLTTVLAIGAYVTKVLLLVVVLAAVKDLDWLSRPAFAVAVVAVSAAWLAGHAAAHVRTVRRSSMRLPGTRPRGV